MRKVLPFVVPDVTCYPATSEACGILFADPAIQEWMYNNFIQIFEVDDSHAIDYYDFAIEKNPFLSYCELDYTFVMRKWDGILSFIKDAIDDNYYVRVFVNTGKLDLYDFLYNQQHDLLIYGYDFEEKNLYVADHFKNGKFSKEECSFENFQKAFDNYDIDKFWNLPAFLRSIQMVKIETDFLRLRYSMYTSKEMDELLTFNINRIIESLHDYLFCRPVSGWFTRGVLMSEQHAKHHKWGLDCYDVLSGFVNKLFDEDNSSFVARQSFFLMYNHKRIMASRIRILGEKGYLSNADVWYISFDNLSKSLYKAMVLYIKISVKRKRDFKEKDKLINQLSEIHRHDKELTEKLLMNLKKI